MPPIRNQQNERSRAALPLISVCGALAWTFSHQPCIELHQAAGVRALDKRAMGPLLLKNHPLDESGRCASTHLWQSAAKAERGHLDPDMHQRSFIKLTACAPLIFVATGRGGLELGAPVPRSFRDQVRCSASRT